MDRYELAAETPALAAIDSQVARGVNPASSRPYPSAAGDSFGKNEIAGHGFRSLWHRVVGYGRIIEVNTAKLFRITPKAIAPLKSIQEIT